MRLAMQERPVHGVHHVVVDVAIVALPFAVAEEGAVVGRGELLGELQLDRLGMERVAEIAEDHAVALLCRERFYAVLALELAPGTAGNGNDGAVLAHLHAVIAAGDAITHRDAHGERRAAMGTVVLEHDRRARLVAPQNQLHAHAAQRNRLVAEEMRGTDRIPDVPYALGEKLADRLIGHRRHGSILVLNPRYAPSRFISCLNSSAVQG